MLGKTVGELERELTWDDVEEWQAYITIKNEREKEQMAAAERDRKLQEQRTRGGRRFKG